jgi:hypothetical protein
MSETVVCIEWIDSASYEDGLWKSEEEKNELVPMRIKSAGILVNEDDVYITLAGSINNSDKEVEAQYGELISIPKFAIVKRWSFPRSFME